METELSNKTYIRIKSAQNKKYWYAKLIGRVIVSYREIAVSGDWRVSYSGLTEEDYQLMNMIPKRSPNCFGEVQKCDAEVVTEQEYLDCQKKAALNFCILKLTRELKNS